FFFFHDTAPHEIYPLSLPDPLPIHWAVLRQRVKRLLTSSLSLKKAQQLQLEYASIQAWEKLQRQLLDCLSKKISFPKCLDQTIQLFNQTFGAEQVWVQDAKNQKLLSVETLQHRPEAETVLALLEELMPISNQIVYYSDTLMGSDSNKKEYSKVGQSIAEELNIPALLMAPIFSPQKFWGWLMISGQADQVYDELIAQRCLDMAQWIAIALA
ncbi:MAG: hypothetical protein F6K16_37985, partial [Symploca sp. SIO2B6]|nr:hypothetical protein [Symploca sp. SIO2B6]